MIIKINPSASVSSGKIGGQYIQQTESVASFRTKRNGRNKFQQYSRPQRGSVQSLAILYNSLTASQKAWFIAYGNANPNFGSSADSGPLYGFQVFLTLNSKLRLAGYSPISSIGFYFSQTTPILTVSSITWNPFTIVGSKTPGTTGQSYLFYVQMNLGVTAAPHERNAKMIFAKGGFNSTISGFQAAVYAAFNMDVPYKSMSVRLERINSNGRVYEKGPLLTFPFS